MEINESTILSSPEWVVAELETLHRRGFEIHMDDFGTGHSSLSWLHRFPVDVLKIDRTCMIAHVNNRDYAAIIDAIIVLSHNLNAAVIAEGLELPEQLAQLLALNCDFGQGYLFAKPLHADEATAKLTQSPLRLPVAG